MKAMIVDISIKHNAISYVQQLKQGKRKRRMEWH